MSQSLEPEAADVRAAMATLVSSEPALPTGTADIERRGRRRLAQRRLGGAVAAVVVLAAGGLAVANLGGSEPGPSVAQPPGTSTTDPAGSGLAVGFPIGSAVDAVGAALPPGASLGELPMDIRWRAGGLLDVPIAIGPVTGTPPAPTHVVTIHVADGTCVASVTPSDALTQADLDAIAASVCAAWVEAGSLPVIPGVPGEENPDLAAS